MQKSLFIFLYVILMTKVVFGQTYDPHTPYTYQKSDTTKPISKIYFSWNEEKQGWTKLTMRDPIVDSSEYSSYEGKTYYHLGWRDEFTFVYSEMETMKSSTPTETKMNDDGEIIQYDVRDFLASNELIVINRLYDYVQLTIHSWVPGGIYDFYGDGQLIDYNDNIKIYKGGKRRNHDTGIFEDNFRSCHRTEGRVRLRFKNEQQMKEILEKIRKYGKKTDPYIGDPNPLTYTLNSKTNEKITLNREDIIISYGGYTDFLFVKDALVWHVEIDSSKNTTTDKWDSKATIQNIPISSITHGDFEIKYTDRGHVCETRLISKSDGVVNDYDFGLNRRGISTRNIGKEMIAKGYNGANNLFIYFKDEQHLRDFLAKIGKSDIPMKNFNE